MRTLPSRRTPTSRASPIVFGSALEFLNEKDDVRPIGRLEASSLERGERIGFLRGIIRHPVNEQITCLADDAGGFAETRFEKGNRAIERVGVQRGVQRPRVMIPRHRKNRDVALDQPADGFPDRNDGRLPRTRSVEEITGDENRVDGPVDRGIGDRAEGVQHLGATAVRISPKPSERSVEVNVGEVQKPEHRVMPLRCERQGGRPARYLKAFELVECPGSTFASG